MPGLIDTIRGLFSNKDKAGDRKKMVSLDLITSDLENIPSGALAALWEQHDQRMPHTPRMIRASRRAMNGEDRAAMAPEWDEQDRDDFETGGPDAYTRPRETAARLASRQARIKRPVASMGPQEQKDSTRIEQFGNAVLDDQFADYETVEMDLNESQSLWIAVPSPCHWKVIPTLYDEAEDEGKHASKDEYDNLPEKRKREYERANPSDDDEPRYKRMRKRYRVNSKGEEDDDSPDFEVDYKRSARSFEESLKDIRARNFPVVLRGPISRLDFVPLDPAFSGKRTNVEGVIIRTLYRQSKLARHYMFEGCEGLIEATGADGKDGDLYLYELWAYDEWHRPFVAYQVGTKSTHWKDSGSTAVIRLWEEYPGITELPIAFEYGQHTADPDPDKRGLAFPVPYLKNWRQRDAILTALCISIAKSGYPTWGQVLTEESLKVLDSLPGDIPVEFTMRPNVVQPVVGQLVELTSKGTNADVKVVFDALNVMNEKELPSKVTAGGEGASSGLERQIIGRDMEISFGPTIEGYRRQKEAMGRFVLMIASALGKKAGQPVELYAIGTAPNPETGGTATTRTRLTLPPDICKDNWEVVAQFEIVPGEKLAQSSLFLEALSQGAILLREWREWGVGDTQPEQFIWEKMLEDFYLKDPAGRLAVYKGMLDYVADRETREMLELAHQGETTGAQGGFSTAGMDDLLGTGSAQPGMGQLASGVPANTGMRLGGSAQSQLAGANAGAMAASAAGAGSPLDGGRPV